MMGMMGAAAPMPPQDPMAMLAPGAGAPMQSPFPSTDPAVVGQIISLIGGMQQQDHANLQMQQDGVLQMLLATLMPAPAPQQALPPMMDAGFAEGGEAPMGGPEEMLF